MPSIRSRQLQPSTYPPHDVSVLSLLTVVVVDTHDEWAVARTPLLSEESLTTLIGPPTDTTEETLLDATTRPKRSEVEHHTDVEPHHSPTRSTAIHQSAWTGAE